jgi:hypothetical protein
MSKFNVIKNIFLNYIQTCVQIQPPLGPEKSFLFYRGGLRHDQHEVRVRPFGIDLCRSLLRGGRCSEVVVKTDLTVQCKQAFCKRVHRPPIK